LREPTAVRPATVAIVVRTSMPLPVVGTQVVAGEVVANAGTGPDGDADVARWFARGSGRSMRDIR